MGHIPRLGNPCHHTVYACAYRSLSRSPIMHSIWLVVELHTVRLTPSMLDSYFLVIWQDSGSALPMPPGGVMDPKQERHLSVIVCIQTCYVSVVLQHSALRMRKTLACARNSRAVLNWQVAHAWLLCVVFVQLGVLGCVVKGSGFRGRGCRALALRNFRPEATPLYYVTYCGSRATTPTRRVVSRDNWSGVKSGPPRSCEIWTALAKSGPGIQKPAAVGEQPLSMPVCMITDKGSMPELTQRGW